MTSATDDSRYPVPGGRHRAEIVVERSRFIATVGPAPTADEAAALVQAVSGEFGDASHNCWAFVAGSPGSTRRVGMSDDGEPHGTAGRPMLTTLLHSGLGDIAAVVTRYFGGVKLGTGGLARAYAAAVNHALDSVPRSEHVTWSGLRVQVDYGAVGGVQQILPGFEAMVIDEAYADSVTYYLQVPQLRLEALRTALLELTSGRAVFLD